MLRKIFASSEQFTNIKSPNFSILYRWFAMPPKRKISADSGENDPARKKTKKEKDETNKLIRQQDDNNEETNKDNKKVAKPNKDKKAAKVIEQIPDVNLIDFSNNSTTADGIKWNMKFSSWNVNGIRAWLNKNGHSYISAENPDVFCVQETKCNTKSLPNELKVPGYKNFWLSGVKDGYSGTGIYSKREPIAVTYGIGIEEHDDEGRVITAEYDNFYFVTVYVPNSGRGLVRLKYRTEEWDPAFRTYLKGLDEKKPVIMCGDLNVAHGDLDLANPKTNQKTSGFTPEERAEFGKLLEDGFVDTFRHLYPEQENAYSYWTYMRNCRAKNIGWRLDYFIISERLKENLCDSVIRKDVIGSDHCPVVCFMNFK